jgi:hypothetical protein
MRTVLSLLFAIGAVLGCALPALAAGGFNPPPEGAQIGRVEFRANIMLDPHNAAGDLFGAVTVDATTTAKRASIQLRDAKKGTFLSEVSFRALPTTPFSLGCDASLSAARFLYTPQNGALLAQWVPPAALQYLFGPVGVTVGPTNQPAIVEILTPESQQCVPDPRNPTTADGSTPGLLLMDVVIRFQIFP